MWSSLDNKLWVAVLQTTLLFRGHSEDGLSLFLLNSIHSELFYVCVEGHNFNAFLIEMM